MLIRKLQFIIILLNFKYFFYLIYKLLNKVKYYSDTPQKSLYDEDNQKEVKKTLDPNTKVNFKII